MKGRTRPLKQLPPEIARGINLVIGRGSTTLFMGSVDKNTVTWSLSQRIPQSQAAEMNETFKDPAAAQVSVRCILGSKGFCISVSTSLNLYSKANSKHKSPRKSSLNHQGYDGT